MLKRIFLVTLTLSVALCLFMSSAFACTLIYVGSAVSQDGSTIFGRSEDYANSQNKLFYVAEAGKHKAGEVYNGCYGFSYTFTHDSYSYTAFSDDNGEAVDFVCPDCGQTHPHTPYEAAGTNSMGLTVTATETIYGSEAIEAVDPYEDAGIEEAEIVTVLLSESGSAAEAIHLLTSIYDGAGANAGSGIIIADAKEVWYIENVSGHQYIALKLSDTLVMTQPNMVVIGLVDLDDSENVIYSENLIAVAQQAGSFVGDAEQNQINYVASYCGGTEANARMVNAQGYFTDECAISCNVAADDNYLLSNLDENGAITAVHSSFVATEKLSIEDVQEFYHISNIGYQRNLEGHIFQIFDESATGTVEWVAMNDNALAVFVPYYPMLTTDVYEGYKLSTPVAEFVTEAPESGVYYPTTVNRRVDGQRVAVDGFMVIPEGWENSVYWTNDVVSNTVLYCGLDEAVTSATYDSVYALQAEVNAAFAQLDTAALDAETATQWSMAQAEAVHQAMIAIAQELVK
ncbi:MAG: C69 family dipeptidase [Clostridia bacterium]|nr:C69 family dipeptidase [Clostridia bacterium]